MSDSDQGRVPVDVEVDAKVRIDRAVGRARLALLWEALWPRIAPLVVLAVLFAAVSWLGVWRLTNTPARYAILAVFALAALGFLVRLVRFAWPTTAAALARVEQATGVPHRPATAFTDRMATGGGDPFAEALWTAHRRRLLAAMERLRAGVPAPKLTQHDPVALRFLVVLLAVVGFFVAGSERIDRIGEAFRGGESVASLAARIDAWVTPPAYTGRPPIFLTGEAAKPAGTVYSVPTGSIVTVRTGGAQDLDVVNGDTTIAPTAAKASAGAEPPLEHQLKLTQAASVAVKKGTREISAWRFTVEPDNPPSIALVGEPRVAESGALHLTYSMEDDYGIVAAFGEFAPADPLRGKAARPLYDAPKLPLSLPQLRTRKGQGETTRDLTSHPWAGAKLKLTLVARDEAGQEGRSAPVEITLPSRSFANPLARAVVEQRTDLALDANARDTVADALDALTMAPEDHMRTGDYLMLRSAYHRLVDAHDDNELRGIVDYLWNIALGIEDQGTSLAAEQLRAAQDALRQALERNASDDEIAKLTQDLREALQKFLQALAEQAQRNPNTANNMPPNANMRELRPQDLDRMLDQIENLARTGAKDAARQLLSELQNMLENLQAGQPQQGGDQADQQGMQALNQLGDMIRRQESLMNQTFRAQRGQGENGQEMSPEQLQQALKDLQSQQQALNEQLQKLMQDMQGQGMDPNGKLGQAGDSMGRAADALGNSRPGSAVGEQSSALDALRQGAQGLAQQLAQQGQQQGQGQGQGRGMRSGNGAQEYDPLGRPRRTTGSDLGSTVKVPDEIDTQRAREILDAIRQRLGDSYRPEIERDYLERLLEPF
jgi:uncharacterized protein (TIGR02302 family)